MTDRPLQLVFSFSPGGTLGRAFAAIAEDLARRGHGVTVLVPPAYEGEPVEGLDLAEPRAWPGAAAGGRARRFAEQVLADTDADAVIGSFSGTNALLVAARRRRVPARMAWHHTSAAASRLDGGGGPRFHLLRWRKRLHYRSATDLLVATDHLVDDLVRSYGVDRARITVEPFAIPDPGPQAVARRPNRLVAVGRLYPVKGLEWLLRSLRQVPGVELHVLGDGPERARLEAQSEGLPVTFLGTVDRDAVSRELAEAALAVVPSRDEGFGLVTVEAQAVGTPVVASDLEAFRTTVEDGVTGVLVPVDAVGALGTAINDLLRDEPRRIEMGEAGRRRFEARFDLAARLPALADGYERLVRRRLP